MKANELMIGDWVLYNDNSEQHPRQIIGISTLLNNVELWDGSNWVNVGEKYINPIPLTEEILEKNGFKKNVWWKYRESDVTTYAIGDGFHIELSENEFWLVDNCFDSGDYGYESNWIIEVKYVHKLQHLMKELEIEKEIVL